MDVLVLHFTILRFCFKNSKLSKNLHTYENFRLGFREMSLSFQTGTLILYKSNIQKTWADLRISTIEVIQKIAAKNLHTMKALD